MASALTVEDARRAYDSAHYGDASIEAQNAALADLKLAEEAADPTLKARRLRLKASDARATYQRHMDAYGLAIGRSQARFNQGDITLSTSFAREAAACLACATGCLIEAEKAEHEADRLARFVVLFDGVSAQLEAAE